MELYVLRCIANCQLSSWNHGEVIWKYIQVHGCPLNWQWFAANLVRMFCSIIGKRADTIE